MSVRVPLSEAERVQCYIWAQKRQEDAERRGKVDRYGKAAKDPVLQHMRGVFPEYATSKVLDIPFENRMGEFREGRTDLGDRTEVKGGGAGSYMSINTYVLLRKNGVELCFVYVRGATERNHDWTWWEVVGYSWGNVIKTLPLLPPPPELGLVVGSKEWRDQHYRAVGPKQLTRIDAIANRSLGNLPLDFPR